MTLFEANEIETSGFVSFHVFVFYSTNLNEHTDETHQFNYDKTDWDCGHHLPANKLSNQWFLAVCLLPTYCTKRLSKRSKMNTRSLCRQ